MRPPGGCSLKVRHPLTDGRMNTPSYRDALPHLKIRLKHKQTQKVRKLGLNIMTHKKKTKFKYKVRKSGLNMKLENKI